MSLRDCILSANDQQLQAVDVPEWGCQVWLKPLNGHQRSQLVKAIVGGAVAYGPALASSLCDEGGQLLFGPDDFEAINAKSGKVLERLSALVIKLNGLDGSDGGNG